MFVSIEFGKDGVKGMSNESKNNIRVVRHVDRGVLGSEEADFVPLPITDDRNLNPDYSAWADEPPSFAAMSFARAKASLALLINDKWVVQRIEADGHATRTVELPEDEATARYSNWCENAKLFNDQSTSLIQVERTEKVISTHTNTNWQSGRAE